MRKTLVYVAAWLAAGVAAVAFASIGVSMVGRQVTADRPSPLSAGKVRSELETGTDPGDASRAVTTTSPQDAPPTTAASGGGAVDPGRGTDRSPSSGSPVTSAPRAGDVADDAPTTTGAPPAPSPETRSYTLVGGSVTLRFTPAGVTIVAASPNAGFSVETEPTHDTGVRVRFRSDARESQVEGWWDAGPRDEVREAD